MQLHEKETLERLVSVLCDDLSSLEAAPPELVQELESLLINRPDLQDEYFRLTGIDFMLRHELQLCSTAAHGGSASPEAVLQAEQASLAGDSGSTLGRLVPDYRDSARDSARGLSRRTRLLGAAALLATAASVAFWILPLAFDANNPSVDAFQNVGEEQGMVIKDFRVLDQLKQLNRTDSLASITLPLDVSSGSSPVTLCSGSAWMDFAQDARERGYLLSLPPGVKMDVLIDANASCHNSISVVELGSAGQMTGQTLSFTNLVETGQDSLANYPDNVGQFTAYNDSDVAKHYLITGTYKLLEDSGSAHWRTSDFRVHFSNSEFLVIGWDDCGYSEVARIAAQGPDSDQDFDDIRAMFHFTGPGVKKADSPPAMEPEPIEDSALAEVGAQDYLLDVRPGEMALLLLSSDAYRANSLQIVDSANDQIVWRYESSQPRWFSTADKTVYLIRNKTETVQRFALQGRFKEGEFSEWQASPHKILIENERNLVVGFEDNLASEKKADWNDLRVDIHYYGKGTDRFSERLQ